MYFLEFMRIYSAFSIFEKVQTYAQLEIFRFNILLNRNGRSISDITINSYKSEIRSLSKSNGHMRIDSNKILN